MTYTLEDALKHEKGVVCEFILPHIGVKIEVTLFNNVYRVCKYKEGEPFEELMRTHHQVSARTRAKKEFNALKEENELALKAKQPPEESDE